MSRDGFVFAATGEKYTILARRAARHLRQKMPDAQIDLFTDQQVNDPTFDQIHPTEQGYFRPKITAMRDSRFKRTVYLDADVIVCAPVPELFDVLDTHDLAAAQEILFGRGTPPAEGKPPIPLSFAPINSGVFVVKKSPATRAYLDRWSTRLRKSQRKLDQPDLEHMLFNNTTIRFATLPYIYNFKRPNLLKSWVPLMGAPRILHNSEMHKRPPGDPEQLFDLKEEYGPKNAKIIEWLLAADAQLGGDPSLQRPGFQGHKENVAKLPFARSALRKIRRLIAGR